MNGGRFGADLPSYALLSFLLSVTCKTQYQGRDCAGWDAFFSGIVARLSRPPTLSMPSINTGSNLSIQLFLCAHDDAICNFVNSQPFHVVQ